MARYGTFNRPLWPGFKVSEPFEVDQNHTRRDNKDPFDVIRTKKPLPESDLFSMELKDLDVLDRQRDLQNYLRQHDLKIGVKTAISHFISEGKVTSKADVDKMIKKADRRRK